MYNNTCKEQNLQVRKEGRQMNEMTEKERKDVQKAVVYDIRLAVDADSKEEYTKEEILKMLDAFVRAREE